jgi:hypothetical protein
VCNLPKKKKTRVPSQELQIGHPSEISACALASPVATKEFTIYTSATSIFNQ